MSECPRCDHEMEETVTCERCGFVVVSVDQMTFTEMDAMDAIIASVEAEFKEPVLDSTEDVGASDDDPPSESDAKAGGETRAARVRPPSNQIALDFADVNPKPPYQIPSMAEILATPKHGLKMVSTFSGCGGSCLGFTWAGWDVLSANEFIPEAQRTYAANFPNTPIILPMPQRDGEQIGDIRNYEPEMVMAYHGLQQGELDVLEGSPPCASFSTAGGREKGWGQEKAYSDTRQRTDDLFDEYVRLIAGFMPRAFVAENVVGFLYGAADHFRKWIEGEMRSLGYMVTAKIVDASHHGVPQKRRRVILIGVRRDQGINPLDLYPSRLPYVYTIRDALPWLNGNGHLPLIVADRRTSTVKPEDYYEQPLDEPSPTVTACGVSADDYTDWSIYGGQAPPTQEELIEASIEDYAIGAAWRELKEGETSERYFNLIRSDPDQPVATVTATAGVVGAAGVTHPSEPRKFTIPELRRLCGFPDDFQLTGTFPKQWERLGRAVPPPMMRAVAAKVAEALQ